MPTLWVRTNLQRIWAKFSLSAVIGPVSSRLSSCLSRKGGDTLICMNKYFESPSLPNNNIPIQTHPAFSEQTHTHTIIVLFESWKQTKSASKSFQKWSPSHKAARHLNHGVRQFGHKTECCGQWNTESSSFPLVFFFMLPSAALPLLRASGASRSIWESKDRMHIDLFRALVHLGTPCIAVGHC
jgi:hypothetical protein